MPSIPPFQNDSATHDDERPVAVVTGASAGVGRALAHALAQRGYRIGLLARGKERLSATLEEVRSLGGDGVIACADVSDYHNVERAAALVAERLGPIDVWVNNAMVTVLASVEDIQPGEFSRITDVTYLGSVWGTMVALDHMRERDSGHII